MKQIISYYDPNYNNITPLKKTTTTKSTKTTTAKVFIQSISYYITFYKYKLNTKIKIIKEGVTAVPKVVIYTVPAIFFGLGLIGTILLIGFQKLIFPKPKINIKNKIDFEISKMSQKNIPLRRF
jgi:hypothetical protein